MTIDVRRVYDPAGPDDGTRVLVDRLWPRGMSKGEAHLDAWRKDLAPSSELRTWFHQDPDGRFEEFAQRYRAELDGNPAVAQVAAQGAGNQRLTLLFGARDVERNHALVLRDVLRDYLEEAGSASAD